MDTKKVTSSGVQFRERFLGASEGSRGGFWGPFRKALGPFSLVSDQEFVRNVNKCCLGVFLGEKSTRLVLQKHANRTVHPLKIEGELTVAYVFRNVSQSD